jgi:hypothetical protein
LIANRHSFWSIGDWRLYKEGLSMQQSAISQQKHDRKGREGSLADDRCSSLSILCTLCGTSGGLPLGADY